MLKRKAIKQIFINSEENNSHSTIHHTMETDSAFFCRIFHMKIYIKLWFSYIKQTICNEANFICGALQAGEHSQNIACGLLFDHLELSCYFSFSDKCCWASARYFCFAISKAKLYLKEKFPRFHYYGSIYVAFDCIDRHK